MRSIIHFSSAPRKKALVRKTYITCTRQTGMLSTHTSQSTDQIAQITFAYLVHTDPVPMIRRHIIMYDEISTMIQLDSALSMFMLCLISNCTSPPPPLASFFLCRNKHLRSGSLIVCSFSFSCTWNSFNMDWKRRPWIKYT